MIKIKKFDLKKGVLAPIIPESGGGLSMETYLLEKGKNKYIVRRCNSEKRAEYYEVILKRLSKYGVLPKQIKRNGKNIIYEYLCGRDLKKKENFKVFEQVGQVCAKINSVKKLTEEDINIIFYKQLEELRKGSYRKFTLDEMKGKRKRRPNERHDIRRIKPLITNNEEDKIKRINNSLIENTKAIVCLDAVDVSPANFRLSKGKVYFVDIGGIKTTIKGIGLAKGLWGWAQTEKQRLAILHGYFSISKEEFSEDYLNLIRLHYIIQSLHDRVKIGRDYKKQLLMLKSFLKNYPKD
ncbi:MAG: hypothetical protein ABIF88_02880 [archaeon]